MKILCLLFGCKPDGDDVEEAIEKYGTAAGQEFECVRCGKVLTSPNPRKEYIYGKLLKLLRFIKK